MGDVAERMRALLAETEKPHPRDFDCPDCHVKAGESCVSSAGNKLPSYHTRRVYKAQDAYAKQKNK